MKYILLLCISYLYLNANAHIFVYHRFGDDAHKSTNTTIKQLKEQFEYLKKNNYEVVPTSKIINRINENKKVPDNWVALHIDDSYKSFFENGLPIFKEYNYPFSLFVYVEATEKNYSDFMSWQEIKEASKYGEIALHSYSHKHLTRLSSKEVYKDTKKSYEIFTKKLGFKPKGYVYPYGEYNQEVKQTVKRFDFEYIANQSLGSVNKNSDIHDLHRIAVVGDVNIKQKLRYKTLEAKWIEPKDYPKDGILKKVKVKINPKIKNAKLYISGYGWQNIKAKNGIISLNVNKRLKFSRNRVAISPDYYTISSKLLIK